MNEPQQPAHPPAPPPPPMQAAPPIAATASTWHACAHRADFASAAEHDRDCPVHSLDALALDLLADMVGPLADVDRDGTVALLVDHGPVKPPYGTGCRCDWLGKGTPEHKPSPMCRSLRPDAARHGDAR